MDYWYWIQVKKREIRKAHDLTSWPQPDEQDDCTIEQIESLRDYVVRRQITAPVARNGNLCVGVSLYYHHISHLLHPGGCLCDELLFFYWKRDWVKKFITRWRQYIKRKRAARVIRQFYFDYVQPFTYNPRSRGKGFCRLEEELNKMIKS